MVEPVPQKNAPKGCKGACIAPFDMAFRMAFQPIVDVDARRITAYESLVRGPDGEGAGAVLGAVTEENRYGFDQACRVRSIETASRLDLGCRLHINFLPNAVYEPAACLSATLEAAQRTCFSLKQITFEFTEDERIVDREHLKAIISTYREFGFQTALDDFGAGYAGLSLLADFQPDVIKIDRFLISNIHNDLPRRTIVQGIVSTAQALGIEVLAEGVEQREECDVLTGFGITTMQGFLFARPALEHLATEDEISWP